MGTNPKTCAANEYLQSWDCRNLFVIGALAYRAAVAIKHHVKNPGPLVSA